MTRRSLATLIVASLTGPPAVAYGPSGPSADGGTGGGDGAGGGDHDPVDGDEIDRTRFLWKTHRVPGCAANDEVDGRPCQDRFRAYYAGDIQAVNRSECGGQCKPNPDDRQGPQVCTVNEIGEQGNVLTTKGPDWDVPSYKIKSIAQWDANPQGKCKRERLLWCITSKRCSCVLGVYNHLPQLLCKQKKNDTDRAHSLGAFAFSANGGDCKPGQPWGGNGPAPEEFHAVGNCHDQDEL